jgi:hypothetical protein
MYPSRLRRVVKQIHGSGSDCGLPRPFRTLFSLSPCPFSLPPPPISLVSFIIFPSPPSSTNTPPFFASIFPVWRRATSLPLSLRSVDISPPTPPYPGPSTLTTRALSHIDQRCFDSRPSIEIITFAVPQTSSLQIRAPLSITIASSRALIRDPLQATPVPSLRCWNF